MATYIKCDKCGEYVPYGDGFTVYVEKKYGSAVDEMGKRNIDFCRKCTIELLTECNKMEVKEK